jgi:quinohemoprotein amine dehydrogenase
MEPRGQFQPAPAGPNPARQGLNNTGDLTVVARVADGDDKLEARAHLMVTVQRWNKPPLR